MRGEAGVTSQLERCTCQAGHIECVSDTQTDAELRSSIGISGCKAVNLLTQDSSGRYSRRLETRPRLLSLLK